MGINKSQAFEAEALEAGTRYDYPPPFYLWVDAKMHGHENKLYIARFKELFEVEGLASFEELRAQVAGWEGRRLGLICAASLKDEEFRFLQDNDKVERILLFCGNKTRAGNLMRDFPKVTRACFNYHEVTKAVKAWQQDSLTSLLFFDPQGVDALNRLNANILALTQGSSSEGRELYREYFRRFLKEEDLASFESMDGEYSRLKGASKKPGSKEAVLSFFREKFLNSSVFVSETNFLLRATSNPRKLANLRYLLADLFHTLKDAYCEAKAKQNCFSAVVSLHQQELNRLKASVNSYVVFTHFVQAALVAPSSLAELKEFEIIVEIEVPPKEAGRQGCNGYIEGSKSALFNLGNYFQVKGFSEEDRTVRVRLVSLDEGGLKDKERELGINRAWVAKQCEQHGGQYYSLFLHDQETANQYLEGKMAAARKEKREEVVQGWAVSRARLAIRAGKSAHQVEQSLECMGQEVSPMLASLTLCELFFAHNNNTRFQLALKKLASAKQKEAKEIWRKIQIFRLYDRFLSSPLPKERRDVVYELGKIEHSMKQAKNYEASEDYHLLVSITIKCLEELGLYEEELGNISHLTLIYSITEGSNCGGVAAMNQAKMRVKTLMDENLAKREAERKAKIFTSSVQIDLLKRKQGNSQKRIDISKMKIKTVFPLLYYHSLFFATETVNC